MKKLVASALLLTPRLAFAHPGHGTTDPTSLRHYVVEPVHAVVILAAVIAASVGIALWSRKKARRQPQS